MERGLYERAGKGDYAYKRKFGDGKENWRKLKISVDLEELREWEEVKVEGWERNSTDLDTALHELSRDGVTSRDNHS